MVNLNTGFYFDICFYFLFTVDQSKNFETSSVPFSRPSARSWTAETTISLITNIAWISLRSLPGVDSQWPSRFSVGRSSWSESLRSAVCYRGRSTLNPGTIVQTNWFHEVSSVICSAEILFVSHGRNSRRNSRPSGRNSPKYIVLRAHFSTGEMPEILVDNSGYVFVGVT